MQIDRHRRRQSIGRIAASAILSRLSSRPSAHNTSNIPGVEAGLSHDDAVRAFTLSAAEIFGAADRLGSLDVGKIANLVVTDGDLLDDSTKVEMVFVDGKRFEPQEDTGGQRFARGGQGGPAGRAGGRGGRGGQAGRRAGGQGGQAGEQEGPSDVELRGRIGGSLRGPYRDDDVMLIRNATVMTVTNGTIENGSVLIRNGKIAEVGTDIAAPRGAHVIDAQGQYVIPGIIDAHSHIAGGSNEGAVAVSADPAEKRRCAGRGRSAPPRRRRRVGRPPGARRPRHGCRR